MKKKYLLLMGLALTFSVFAENNIIEIKDGYEVQRNIKQKYGNGYKKLKFDNGFNLSGEYRREIFENIRIEAVAGSNFNNDKNSGNKYSFCE